MRPIHFSVIFHLIVVVLTGFSPVHSDEGYSYLSPKPGSIHVPPQTSIVLRFDGWAPVSLANLDRFIRVSGRRSGEVSGTARVASDKKTVLFTPESPFVPGDEVTVTLAPRFAEAGAAVPDKEYGFTVSKTLDGIRTTLSDPEIDGFVAADRNGPAFELAATAQIMANGVSVPSDFPLVKITMNNNPDTGYIFLNNWGGQPYNMILDNTGSPIWYLKTPDRRRDFKVQKDGNLSMLVRQGYSFGHGFIALDHSYKEIDTFHAVDGYGTDEHELQVLEDGGYLLIGRREDQIDMSKYVTGGKRNATVRECAIQEFTPDHELIFQWRAWDYFDIRDSYVPGENDLTGGYIRFPHMNAIDIDDDGHILLSSRHLSEVTKINRQTGEIIWRLGGENNEFEFANDPLNGFENQHDIRVLGNNHYTVFDNGNEHDPPVSRAVEYEIDTEQMTATLVWQFRETPDIYTSWMGNTQRLPNGNTLINWADAAFPKLTEVTPDGRKAFEMDFVRDEHCYRVFRFPWDGMADRPNLFVEPSSDRVTLIFNKFGDPDVSYYKIYGSTWSRPTTVLDTSRATLKALTELSNNRRYYFRVTAVNRDGSESAFSEQVSATVRFQEPGQNMVPNGDFSSELDNWTWEVRGSASAEWGITDGAFHFDITQGGEQIWEIQLRQNGFELVQGKEYLFEFDARADQSRIIEAKVAQDHDPWINYSKIGYSSLTQREKQFSYSFKMEEPTDYDSRIVFNTGTSDADVYIDNISLKLLDATAVEHENASKGTTVGFELEGNYPNPFNASTTIPFVLPLECRVWLKLYNVLGELEQDLPAGIYPAGRNRLVFQAGNRPSGIYFYRVIARSLDGERIFSAAGKMMLLK